MIIKVLGPGCMNCQTLERRTINALQQLNINADVIKISDYRQIAESGIMHTPGLIINDKIISQGRVPTVSQLQELIKQELQGDAE